MNKDLQKRLGKYTAAAAAMVGAANANGQVTYTDVNPDYAHGGGLIGYPLDMNNDATNDFLIFSIDTTYTGGPRVRTTLVLSYSSGTVNAIAGETPSSYNYALALNAGDMIDATLNWIAATNTMAYNQDSANPFNENWNGVTDKYLGLKFVVAGNTHYGWARLDVQAVADVWTLKDHAYNATPDAGLMAGQIDGTPSVLGGVDINMDSYVHFVNKPNNMVQVVVNGGLTEGNITLTSVNGQTISNSAIEGNTHMVDLNGLAAGIYVISADFAQGAITKKVIVH